MRNAQRTIVDSLDRDFIKASLYSTDALVITWVDHWVILRITNAKELWESGYVEKIVELISDESAAYIIASAGKNLTFEFRPERLTDGLKFIIDSHLSPEAKLIYVFSFLHHRVPLTEADLTLIFSKRPSPRDEWVTHSFLDQRDIRKLIQNSLVSGFSVPNGFNYDRNAEMFKRICLTSSFISSKKSVTFDEYMRAHEVDFFEPHGAVWNSPNLLNNVPRYIVESMRPAEYVRFMTWFAPHVPKQLLPWAKRRFEQIPELEEETYEKMISEKRPRYSYKLAFGWIPATKFMSAKESERFQQFIEREISSLYSGVSQRAAALFAYYYLEGGERKVEELVRHASRNQSSDARQHISSPFASSSNPRFDLNWSNDFALKSSRRLDLMPYVKALEPEYRDQPLEWSLAVL